MPQSVRDATVAIEDRRFYKHNGVDFEGIVRAAFKNVVERRDRPGRLDADDAARPQPLQRQPRAQRHRRLQAQDPRGEARLRARGPPPRQPRQALDPHAVPQQRPVRHRRRADRRRHPVGLAHLLRQAREPPHAPARPRCSPGLPQAPSDYNPFLDPDARPRRAATRCSTRCAARATSPPSRRPPRASAPLGVKRSAYYAKRRESYFFDYVRTELIKKYGAARVRAGRAEGLHDDRPEAAAGRAPARSPAACRTPATRRRRS